MGQKGEIKYSKNVRDDISVDGLKTAIKYYYTQSLSCI